MLSFSFIHVVRQLVRKNRSPSSVPHRLRARANLQPKDFSHAPPEVNPFRCLTA